MQNRTLSWNRFIQFFSFVFMRVTFKKYKTFCVLIYSYIDMSGIGKTRNCVETRRLQGGVFSLNFEFFQFPRVLIYLYGKNALYFFYNITQKKSKLFQQMNNGKFSVFTSSDVNTALNQSAFRIHKRYIINIYISLLAHQLFAVNCLL